MRENRIHFWGRYRLPVPHRSLFYPLLAVLTQLAACGSAPAAGIPGRIRPQVGVGATAEQVVAGLLRHPSRLRLTGPEKSKASFHFRVSVQSSKPAVRFGVLAAAQAGRSTILVFGPNGLPYAYFGSGMLVFVDLKAPGTLDVFRGVSAGLVLGGNSHPGHHLLAFAFLFAPLHVKTGFIGLNFTQLLRMAAARATRSSFAAAGRTLVFSKGKSIFTVNLSPPKAQFPILAASLSTPRGNISVSDISVGTNPSQKLFGVTLAALKASGQPLRIRSYHIGEPLVWTPPPSFGSKPGEILASDALERLMPIDEHRVRVLDEHWINRQISALRHSGNSDYGAKSGMLPMFNIFSTLEWGLHNAVDFHAQRTIFNHGYAVYGYSSWEFDRTAYHKLLEKTWGTAEIDRLIETLVGVALSQERGPAQKFVAVDLLSDIGPGKADRQWAKDDDMVTKVFAGHNGNRNMSNFLLGLIRARWGLPVGTKSIAVARRWLVNPKVNIPLRVRALEILCFSGQLPDDRHEIAELEKAYLAKPSACIASPVTGRYLYDLSLCRTGRKILLEELADRHSLLSGQPLLAEAAFNDTSPGSPGFNLAVKTAAKIANDPKYSPALRKAAFYVMCRAPMPIFRKFMLKQFGENAKHFALRMEISLTSRKATGYFIPQLAGLFARGDDNDKVLILEAIGHGFAKGGDANAAEPIIRAALGDADAPVRWGGVGCIGGLKYAGAKFSAVPLCPVLLHLVKYDFRGNLWKGVSVLNCFSLATGRVWEMPTAGMLPGGLPNLQPNSGQTWWQSHYAAARKSALIWAAKHKVR